MMVTGPADVALVRRLVTDQFPHLVDRTVTPLATGATDNTVFRLGADLLVRLPRNADSAERLARELRWLPVISRRVSVRVPEIVAVGRPDLGFGFPWAVQGWVTGRDAAREAPFDRPGVAAALGRFVRELRAGDAEDAPTPGPGNGRRGAALTALDEQVRWGAAVTAELGDLHPFTAGVDVARVLAGWEEALAAPPWTGPPTWVHGDLLPGNVVLRDDSLAAVIDFGCAAVGDPACDGMAGWTLFRGRARTTFLDAAGLDAAARCRARGWALHVGITAAAYHHRTDPAFCTFARTVLDEVLASG